MSTHPFVHLEFSSTDQAAMKAFYGSVFGWEFQDWPEMNYVTFSTGEGNLGGGFNPVTDENPVGTVINYIHCDDVIASIASLEKAGGKLLMPVMEVAGVGQIAIFGDPSDNALGLIQPPPDAE